MLGRRDVPVDRQSQEIWRAAGADREGRLSDELGSELFAAAGVAAESTRSPTEAVARFEEQLASERAASVILDLGKRALARAAAAGGGASGFAAELFAETASYYIARDLASLVGAAGRVPSTSAAVDLKSQIREVAREAVRRAGPAPVDPGAWRGYVTTVLAHLTGTR